MQLTGKQIVERGIITNIDTTRAIQQQGVDVRVIDIKRLEGKGFVPSSGKTILPNYVKVPLVEEGEIEFWDLEPGYYEITLAEGCRMQSNTAMTLVQRSSLLRCGTIIRSSQFDAGFETDNIGTFMLVNYPIRIEFGARVAQTLIMETADVASEDLYKGQWMNDNQRNR